MKVSCSTCNMLYLILTDSFDIFLLQPPENAFMIKKNIQLHKANEYVTYSDGISKALNSLVIYQQIDIYSENSTATVECPIVKWLKAFKHQKAFVDSSPAIVESVIASVESSPAVDIDLYFYFKTFTIELFMYMYTCKQYTACDSIKFCLLHNKYTI